MEHCTTNDDLVPYDRYLAFHCSNIRNESMNLTINHSTKARLSFGL